MPEDVTRQLQDLAEWVDRRWEPQDARALQTDTALAPKTIPGGDRRPRGLRVLAAAACLVIVVGIAGVVLRHRDDQQTSVAVGGPGWTTAAQFAYSDRALSIQAPGIWTGREILLVGALTSVSGPTPPAGTMPALETPAYNPSTNQWRTLPAPPVDLVGPVKAVWTGDTAIVFSSPAGFVTQTPLAAPCQTSGPNAGSAVASLNPATGQWQPRSAPPVAAGAVRSVIWTGSQVLAVFSDSCVISYDPATDTYTQPPQPPDLAALETSSSPTSPLPNVATAVWTGTELVESFTTSDRLIAFNPNTGTTRTLAAPPFAARNNLVWTGSQLIIVDPTKPQAAALEPTAPTWQTLPPPPISPRSTTLDAPLWNGTQLIVWGGNDLASDRTNPTWPGDGASYNPTTNTWTAITPWPGPAFTASATLAGDQLFAWSGGNAKNSNNGTIVAATFTTP